MDQTVALDDEELDFDDDFDDDDIDDDDIDDDDFDFEDDDIDDDLDDDLDDFDDDDLNPILIPFPPVSPVMAGGPIPEPASLATLLLGSLTLAHRKRRPS